MPIYHRFIPVGLEEFIRRIRDDFGYGGGRAARFGVMASLLRHLYRHSYERLSSELCECYAPFDPDCENVTLEAPDEADKARRLARLGELFPVLMNAANYERMSREQIEADILEPSSLGLRIEVDTSAYELLEVFFRGQGEAPYTRRDPRRMFRKVTRKARTYARLVSLVKRRGGSHVYIKSFKDIPANSLEVILPLVKLRMGLVDKVRLSGAGVVGVTGASARMSAKALQLAGSATVAGVVFAAAAGVYGFRTFLGYKNTQQRYLADLARRLYHCNLDNNTGVIHASISAAVEEETQEALLAWAILESERKLIPAEEVRVRARRYLKERFGVEVEYEIGDALRKLIERGLLIDQNGKLNTPDLEGTIAILDAYWDQLYSARTGDQGPVEAGARGKPRTWRKGRKRQGRPGA